MGSFIIALLKLRRNQKGDVARRNQDIEEMGAVAAARAGLIPLDKVIKT